MRYREPSVTRQVFELVTSKDWRRGRLWRVSEVSDALPHLKQNRVAASVISLVRRGAVELYDRKAFPGSTREINRYKTVEPVPDLTFNAPPAEGTKRNRTGNGERGAAAQAKIPPHPDRAQLDMLLERFDAQETRALDALAEMGKVVRELRARAEPQPLDLTRAATSKLKAELKRRKADRGR